MTRRQWDRLPRKEQLRILRHMGVSTTRAFALSYNQLERILNGFFDATECEPGARCAACRFGWTHLPRPTDDS
jgi:hypothetical protein